MNNKIICILILFNVLFINFINSQSYFINGEWNNALNWIGSILPTINDYAIIGNSVKQICRSEINSIEVNRIEIINNGFGSYFGTKYGVTASSFKSSDTTSKMEFYIQPNSQENIEKFLVKIDDLYTVGTLNITNYFNAPLTNITGYGLDGMINVVNSNFVTSKVSSMFKDVYFSKSNVTLYTIRGSRQTTDIKECNVSIIGPPTPTMNFEIYYEVNSNLKFSNSTANIYQWSYFQLSSKIIIENSQVNYFLDIDNKGIELNDGIVEIRNSEFYSNQIIVAKNGSGIQAYDLSRVKIENGFELYDQSFFYSLKSNIDIRNITTIQQNSTFKLHESDLIIFNHFIMQNSSEALLNKTSFTLMKPFVSESSASSSSDNSNDQLYLNLKDYSKFTTNDSTVALFSDILLQDKSTLLFKSSSVYCNSSTILWDQSQFLVSDSIFFIYNEFEINNQSVLLFNSSTILYVNNYINFYSSSVLSVDSSTVTVNGFINIGSKDSIMSIINSILTIETGDFISFGSFSVIDSEIHILGGSFYIKEGGSLFCNNSKIQVNNGIIGLDSSANITILNSYLYNKDGILNVNGDIFLKESSNLNNSAIFNLNSSIISNNQKDQYFNNQGKLNISGSDISIDIELLNDGGLIEVLRNIKVFSLNQMNGSNLTLSNSNSTLDIENNFNTSLNDTITFTIDNEKSSQININQQAIINNSTIIIRINKNNLNDNRNSTLMKFSNLSGTGFSNIKFKSFDPNNGKEEDLENSDCRKINLSKSSLDVLISNSCSISSSSSKISKGAVIGIVFGIVGFVSIVGTFIYFKKPLYYKFKIFKENAINLKYMNK